MKKYRLLSIQAAINTIDRGIKERAATWGETQAWYWVEAIVPSGWERRADEAEAEWLYAARLEHNQLQREVDRLSWEIVTRSPYTT